MNFLFHHIPKSGGRYVSSFFKEFDGFNGHDVDQIWQDIDIDQVESYIHNKGRPTFVITHSFLGKESGWYKLGKGMKGFPEADCHCCLRKFIDHDNWVVFTFVRDPRDVLCSMYFFVRDGFEQNSKWMKNHHTWFNLDITLDEFLSNNCHIRSIPKIWSEFNEISVFNHSNLQVFFGKYGIPYSKSKLAINTSSNKGYNYYCNKEVISNETQEQLNNSDDLELFFRIKEKDDNAN